MSVTEFPLERRISVGDMMRNEARARRQRLYTPPNGRPPGSDLDVLSGPERRKRRNRAAIEAAAVARKAARERHNQLMIEAFERGFIHSRQQPVVLPQKPVDKGEPPLIDGETVFTVTVRDIARAVSRYHQISMIDLVSARRDHPCVRPRQIIMYLARHMTTRTLSYIGQLLGNRDHTTVLHGAQRIAELIRTDERLAADVEAVRAMAIAGRAPTEQPMTG